MKRLVSMLGLFGGLFAVGTVQAANATLKFVDDPAIKLTLATSFDPTGVSKKNIAIDFGSLYATGAGNVTYTYLGKEASDTNWFYTGIVNTASTKIASSFSTASALGSNVTQKLSSAGYLQFTFGTTVPTVDKVTVSSAQIVNKDASFAIIAGNAIAKYAAYDYVLLYNDCGGNGCNKTKSDIDYDDMVVGVKFTAAAAPVPEPETYAMMLLGLGVLGGVARRRRKFAAC